MKSMILALMVLLAGQAGAGSFVVNEVLYESHHHDVVDYLKSRGYRAFVLSSPDYPQITIVAEGQSDSQSDEAIEALLGDTSLRFSIVGLANLVHDSDLVYRVAFHAGRKIFSYTSRPGYFAGTDDAPSCEGLDELTALTGTDKRAFAPFLRQETVEAYTFADDLLVDMLKEEHLPPWVAGVSFASLAEDPEFVEWCESQGFVVERVE